MAEVLLDRGKGDKQNNQGDDDHVDDDQGGDDHVGDGQVDDDQVDDDQGVAGQCRRQAEAADVSKFLSTTHFLFQALLLLNIVLRRNALQYLNLSCFDLFLHLQIICAFSSKKIREESRNGRFIP